MMAIGKEPAARFEISIVGVAGALDAGGIKGPLRPGDQRKNQANLRGPCGTTAKRWPTTAGCSDACQQAKMRVTRRNPTVPGGLFECVETPWVQERAGD
jgi:hypothetical protein